MRGQAGSVSRLEILPYEHFSLVTLDESRKNSGGPNAIFLPCLLYFHVISIPFNCSDTALRVAEAMKGTKVKIFVFHHDCCVSRIWHQNLSPGSLTFSPLKNWVEISHTNPRRNSSQ